MTVRELINKCSLNDLIEVNKKYQEFKDEGLVLIYNNVKEFFDTVEVNSTDADGCQYIFVEVGEENIYNMDEERKFFPTVSFYEEKATDTHYASGFWTWDKYPDLIIDKNCLDIFGEATCLLAVLNEMAFMGYTYKKNSENCEKEEKRLQEAIEEIESQKDNLKGHTFEEFRAEFGIIDKRSEEEIGLVDRMNRKIMMGNILAEEILIDSDYTGDKFFKFHISQEDKINLRPYIKQGLTGEKLWDVFCNLYPHNAGE